MALDKLCSFRKGSPPGLNSVNPMGRQRFGNSGLMEPGNLRDTVDVQAALKHLNPARVIGRRRLSAAPSEILLFGPISNFLRIDPRLLRQLRERQLWFGCKSLRDHSLQLRPHSLLCRFSIASFGDPKTIGLPSNGRRRDAVLSSKRRVFSARVLGQISR